MHNLPLAYQIKIKSLHTLIIYLDGWALSMKLKKIICNLLAASITFSSITACNNGGGSIPEQKSAVSIKAPQTVTQTTKFAGKIESDIFELQYSKSHNQFIYLKRNDDKINVYAKNNESNAIPVLLRTLTPDSRVGDNNKISAMISGDVNNEFTIDFAYPSTIIDEDGNNVSLDKIQTYYCTYKDNFSCIIPANITSLLPNSSNSDHITSNYMMSSYVATQQVPQTINDMVNAYANSKNKPSTLSTTEMIASGNPWLDVGLWSSVGLLAISMGGIIAANHLANHLMYKPLREEYLFNWLKGHVDLDVATSQHTTIGDLRGYMENQEFNFEGFRTHYNLPSDDDAPIKIDREFILDYLKFNAPDNVNVYKTGEQQLFQEFLADIDKFNNYKNQRHSQAVQTVLNHIDDYSLNSSSSGLIEIKNTLTTNDKDDISKLKEYVKEKQSIVITGRELKNMLQNYKGIGDIFEGEKIAITDSNDYNLKLIINKTRENVDYGATLIISEDTWLENMTTEEQNALIEFKKLNDKYNILLPKFPKFTLNRHIRNAAGIIGGVSALSGLLFGLENYNVTHILSKCVKDGSCQTLPLLDRNEKIITDSSSSESSANITLTLAGGRVYKFYVNNILRYYYQLEAGACNNYKENYTKFSVNPTLPSYVQYAPESGGTIAIPIVDTNEVICDFNNVGEEQLLKLNEIF